MKNRSKGLCIILFILVAQFYIVTATEIGFQPGAVEKIATIGELKVYDEHVILNFLDISNITCGYSDCRDLTIVSNKTHSFISLKNGRAYQLITAATTLKPQDQTYFSRINKTYYYKQKAVVSANPIPCLTESYDNIEFVCGNQIRKNIDFAYDCRYETFDSQVVGTCSIEINNTGGFVFCPFNFNLDPKAKVYGLKDIEENQEGTRYELVEFFREPKEWMDGIVVSGQDGFLAKDVDGVNYLFSNTEKYDMLMHRSESVTGISFCRRESLKEEYGQGIITHIIYNKSDEYSVQTHGYTRFALQNPPKIITVEKDMIEAIDISSAIAVPELRNVDGGKTVTDVELVVRLKKEWREKLQNRTVAPITLIRSDTGDISLHEYDSKNGMFKVHLDKFHFSAVSERYPFDEYTGNFTILGAQLEDYNGKGSVPDSPYWYVLQSDGSKDLISITIYPPLQTVAARIFPTMIFAGALGALIWKRGKTPFSATAPTNLIDFVMLLATVVSAFTFNLIRDVETINLGSISLIIIILLLIAIYFRHEIEESWGRVESLRSRTP